MKSIHDIVVLLPDFIQQPVLALNLILIGYFVAKIIAGLLWRLIPSKTRPMSEEYNKEPLNKRISKFCFWLIWTPCCFLGVMKLLPELNPINWTQLNSTEDWKTILLLSSLALVLLLSEPFWEQNLHRFKNLIEATPRYFTLIPIAAILIVPFIFPETNFLSKLCRSIVILTLGIGLSKLAKEVVSSGLDVIDIQSDHLSKFVFCFFMSMFLLVATSIWLSQ